MSPLLVDVHEPKEIVPLLAQSIDRVYVEANVTKEWADYYWWGYQDTTHQIERKQWTELLQMDNVEEQIDRERKNANTTALLIEGIALPSDRGMAIYTARWDIKPKRGRARAYFRQGFHTRIPQMFDRIYSWLDRLDKSGITIIHSPNLAATAAIISRRYKNSQDPDIFAFERYIRPTRPTKIKNPHILHLMAMPGVGEKRARDLVRQFGTLYNVINANPSDLAKVIGPTNTSNLLKEVGRYDT